MKKYNNIQEYLASKTLKPTSDHGGTYVVNEPVYVSEGWESEDVDVVVDLPHGNYTVFAFECDHYVIGGLIKEGADISRLPELFAKGEYHHEFAIEGGCYPFKPQSEHENDVDDNEVRIDCGCDGGADVTTLVDEGERVGFLIENGMLRVGVPYLEDVLGHVSDCELDWWQDDDVVRITICDENEKTGPRVPEKRVFDVCHGLLDAFNEQGKLDSDAVFAIARRIVKNK